MSDAAQLRKALAAYPRESLTRTPTPLDHLTHISRILGTHCYLKRDDLTDLALGGDKPRKLEYELAKARQKGATVLVTCGSAQSNHARLTTAAARRLGMECVVVLSRDGAQEMQGNLLAVNLMGAEVRFIDTTDHWQLEGHAQRICEDLRSTGQVPHYIPVSGTTPLSCLGYVRAGLELVDQLKKQGIQLDAFYTPFGTGGVFTAVMLAMRECGVRCPLFGISVNRGVKACHENVRKWHTALCELLSLDSRQQCEPYEIHDEFIGRGYGDATEAALDSMSLMARSEGILLDPVYSGKAFAGLVAHCQAERWRADQHVLMIHTGGVPAVFAYHDEIAAHLRRRGQL